MWIFPHFSVKEGMLSWWNSRSRCIVCNPYGAPIQTLRSKIGNGIQPNWLNRSLQDLAHKSFVDVILEENCWIVDLNNILSTINAQSFPCTKSMGILAVADGSTTFPPKYFEILNKRTLSPQQSMVSEVFSCSCQNSNFNSFWQFWNQNAGFRWYRHLYGIFFCNYGQIFLFTTREKNNFVKKAVETSLEPCAQWKFELGIFNFLDLSARKVD